VAENAEQSTEKPKRLVIPHLVFYVFGVAAICCARYWQLLSGSFVFASPVHVRYLEPTVGFLRESFATSGRVAAWNPYSYLGMPQLPGCLPGNAYPFAYLYIFLGYETAIVAFLVLHQVVAFVGTYFVSGQFTSRVVTRVVAGVIYVLVDIALVGDANLALCATLAWLPFCLYGLLRCMPVAEHEEKPHPAGLVVVNTVFLGALLAGGAVGYALIVIDVFVIAILVRVVVHQVRSTAASRPAIASYLIGTGLAFCLSAPVVFPLLEWANCPSLVETAANVFRPIPNCVSITGVFTGPQVSHRELRDDAAKETAKLLKSVRSVAGHQGRYLVVLPKHELPADSESALCRSAAANAGMKDDIVSPFGYLGHPSYEYRKFFERVIGGDITRGYINPPADSEAAANLLRFMRITSTGIAISPGWPKDLHASVGFNDWRRFMEPFSKVPGEWHCFQQTIVLPAAYVIDSWHWVKDPNQIIDEHFGLKTEFDPRLRLLVERGEKIEVDEEKLDKMPLSQVTPPMGPPMTDSEHIETLASETRMKAVEIMAYEPEHISLSVRAKRPSFVVVTDTFYPGWKAYVDSVPAPLYRADGVGRAVFVSEGSHAVAFDYRPDSAGLAGYLALGALSFVFVLSFFWLRKLLGKTINFLSVGRFE